jgi:hypothetical protein
MITIQGLFIGFICGALCAAGGLLLIFKIMDDE